jgi:two-component system aerobic respiration control sensor histidine kinase ArcB
MLTSLQHSYDTPILLATQRNKEFSNPIKRPFKDNKLNKMKILIIEDDPMSQRVIQLMVEANGYEVDIAATGEKALELFLKNRYALILMDYGLPDLTGVQITRLIREIEQKKGLFTPIIAQTAHGSHAEQECIVAGMNGLLSKPLIKEELDKILNQWINPTK